MSSLLQRLVKRARNSVSKRSSRSLQSESITTETDDKEQSFTTQEDNKMVADENTSLLKNEAGGTGEGATQETQKLSWSESLMMSHTNEHNHITSAAFLLRDAIILSRESSLVAHTDYLVSMNPITGAGSSDNGCSKFCRRILTQPIVSNLLSLCIIGLVAISFIEPPTWCRDFKPYSDASSSSTLHGCEAALTMQGKPAFYVDDTEDTIQYYYPSVRSDILNVNQAFTLEIIFLSFIFIHTMLCIIKDGFSIQNYLMLSFRGDKVDHLTSRNMRHIRIFRIIRFVSLICLCKGVISESLFSTMPTRRYAIFFRLLMFISYSEGVQRELMIAIELIPSLASVAVVLFMVIGFYGLIGVAAFYNTQEGVLHFSNWVEGVCFFIFIIAEIGLGSNMTFFFSQVFGHYGQV